ncbi:Golgi-associated PDZ and coiled-coil motif-containing protein-like [Octopus sinensis]|uniref:Golgi-associated PDZ and coiled-coil motif-containing protein-like n=1 Tax=Octopus sinensis TaxID=2607531 RepID=A0A7E6FNE5_9MOLL|nr:Golgi-associated PDZ and coiled-coil motif-containing protein-like [Octopus sinensis]
MRSEITKVSGSKSSVEKEVHNLLLQLHSSQLELQASKGFNVDSDAIKKKLEDEMTKRSQEVMQVSRVEAEVKQLKKENHELRQYILALQSEVYGARLAAKYLDKELAGRIQQIQLLGRDMKGAEHDKLWNQLEAEIHLHRHKTVIRACRGRNNIKKKLPVPPGHGGKEHGVPILISEIHPGQPAERCEGLYVGDAILSVNGDDLRNVKHSDAVQILSQQQGQIELEVVFVAPDQDSDDENHEYEDENGFRYRIYDDDVASDSDVSNGQGESPLDNELRENGPLLPHNTHTVKIEGQSNSPTPPLTTDPSLGSPARTQQVIPDSINNTDQDSVVLQSPNKGRPADIKNNPEETATDGPPQEEDVEEEEDLMKVSDSPTREQPTSPSQLPPYISATDNEIKQFAS